LSSIYRVSCGLSAAPAPAAKPTGTDRHRPAQTGTDRHKVQKALCDNLLFIKLYFNAFKKHLKVFITENG
jgi:hypothetical protein